VPEVIHKSGPSPSRVYCIFAQLTNSNVLGKLPIRDSNNREIGIGGFGKIQYTRDGEGPGL
jgi:hypothetical protein